MSTVTVYCATNGLQREQLGAVGISAGMFYGVFPIRLGVRGVVAVE